MIRFRTSTYKVIAGDEGWILNEGRTSRIEVKTQEGWRKVLGVFQEGVSVARRRGKEEVCDEVSVIWLRKKKTMQYESIIFFVVNFDKRHNKIGLWESVLINVKRPRNRITFVYVFARGLMWRTTHFSKKKKINQKTRNTDSSWKVILKVGKEKKKIFLILKRKKNPLMNMSSRAWVLTKKRWWKWVFHISAVASTQEYRRRATNSNQWM